MTGEDSALDEPRRRSDHAARRDLPPGRQAAQVGCPLLVQVGDDDETTPPEPAARMAQRAPRGELLRYPAGHFDPYNGEMFERFVTDQVAFLQRVLVPERAAVASLRRQASRRRNITSSS